MATILGEEVYPVYANAKADEEKEELDGKGFIGPPLYDSWPWNPWKSNY